MSDYYGGYRDGLVPTPLSWNEMYLQGLKVIGNAMRGYQQHYQYQRETDRQYPQPPCVPHTSFNPYATYHVPTTHLHLNTQSNETTSNNNKLHRKDETGSDNEKTISKRKRSLDSQLSYREKKPKMPTDQRRTSQWYTPPPNLASSNSPNGNSPSQSRKRRSFSPAQDHPAAKQRYYGTPRSATDISPKADAPQSQTNEQTKINTSTPDGIHIAIIRPIRLDQPPYDMDRFSQQIWDHYLQNRQTPTDLQRKVLLRDSLFRPILLALPGLQFDLHITGSSQNGFGSRKSDLDICLMLPQKISVTKNAIVDYLYNIEWNIRKKRANFTNLTVIRARVPILRFSDIRSGVDVDININNATGIRNTHLLQAYSKLDWRVAPLVMIIKHWASVHNINDASQSTLSSYTLTLMVLNYLQVRCQPPVLPSLQDLHPRDFATDSDVSQLFTPNSLQKDLPENLQYVSQNTQSLAELLKGFFHYYASEFTFKTRVMSVRLGSTYSKAYLPHSTKYNEWKLLCVEEPFDRCNAARPVFLQDKFLLIKHIMKRTSAKMRNAIDLKEIM